MSSSEGDFDGILALFEAILNLWKIVFQIEVTGETENTNNENKSHHIILVPKLKL